MTCHARGKPGIQSSWSSESTGYNNFTSVGNPVSKQISDFVYDFESTINISSTIYEYFLKKNNSRKCHIVSKNNSELFVKCAMNFKCSVYYEKGHEVSNITTLTVTGLNGEECYSWEKNLYFNCYIVQTYHILFFIKSLYMLLSSYF